MTREEIINMLAQRIINSEKITTMQGAVEYVLQWADEHHISGEQIAAMKNEIKYIKRKLVECDRMYRELQNKNPWRDAKKDPPEDMKPVIGYEYGIIGQYEYSPEEKIWSFGILLSDAPEYWMPIPETPKGGEK